jgi:transglutaminase-like putative cysteine protease
VNRLTLSPTDLIDCGHPAVAGFAARAADGCSDQERAVALYYAVRDGFRYDPYRVDLAPAGMRASTVIEKGYGWCVPKATLLAAACRAVGIPARLGFADVRNHLSTARMRALMQTDVFHWHGYTEIYLDARWVKATPAFNRELCDRFDLRPLEFDGRSDSLYHPFDRTGRRHMEYVADHGSFDDVPLAIITAELARLYPAWCAQALGPGGDQFLADVERETDAAGRP